MAPFRKKRTSYLLSTWRMIRPLRWCSASSSKNASYWQINNAWFRLPLFIFELNPIELAWAGVKYFVRGYYVRRDLSLNTFQRKCSEAINSTWLEGYYVKKRKKARECIVAECWANEGSDRQFCRFCWRDRIQWWRWRFQQHRSRKEVLSDSEFARPLRDW